MHACMHRYIDETDGGTMITIVVRKSTMIVMRTGIRRPDHLGFCTSIFSMIDCCFAH